MNNLFRAFIGLIALVAAASAVAQSFKPVSLTAATYTLRRSQADAILIANRAAGITITLPAASGTGDVYRVLVGTTITSNSLIIRVANASDTMVGWVEAGTTTGATTNGFAEAIGGTDDTFTMNGTTTGGIIGSYVECQDSATNLWRCTADLVSSGTMVTSVSATVS